MSISEIDPTRTDLSEDDRAFYNELAVVHEAVKHAKAVRAEKHQSTHLTLTEILELDRSVTMPHLAMVEPSPIETV